MPDKHAGDETGENRPKNDEGKSSSRTVNTQLPNSAASSTATSGSASTSKTIKSKVGECTYV